MKALYGRILLFGFLIYASEFMLWSFFAAYDQFSPVSLLSGFLPQVLSHAITALAAFLAARFIAPASIRHALTYGILWTLMHILFDILYVIPAAGAAALFTSFMFITCAIVLFIPITVFYISHRERALTRENV